MRFEDYDTLSSILNEFRREKLDIEIQIEHNLKCMKTAEAYLSSYVDSVSDDFRIFSPRKADTEEKRRIENVSEEKAACEEANKKLLARKNILTDYVERLENVLEYSKTENTERNDQMESICKDTLSGLDNLVQRMEGCFGYIEKNPVQAKQDFIIIGRYLKEIADKLRNCLKQEE